MKERFFFRKAEKLVSKKHLETLFKENVNTLFSHPFRFTWVDADLPTNYPAQVVFVVSKKKFRKSHQRNRIKRQMREVYRKNKHLLYNHLSSEDKKQALLMAYVSPLETPTEEMERNFLKIIRRFVSGENKPGPPSL